MELALIGRGGDPFLEDISPGNELPESPSYGGRGSRMTLFGTFTEGKMEFDFRKEDVAVM